MMQTDFQILTKFDLVHFVYVTVDHSYFILEFATSYNGIWWLLFRNRSYTVHWITLHFLWSELVQEK